MSGLLLRQLSFKSGADVFLSHALDKFCSSRTAEACGQSGQSMGVCRPSWRQAWDIPTREQLSLFAVSLYSTIFCQLCLAQPEILHSLAWNADARVHGRIWVRQQGLQDLQVCPERRRAKDGKGVKNKWEVNTGVLLRTCKPHVSPLLSLLLHLIKSLKQIGEFPWEEKSS
ncbi:hypothetical protein WISP_82963 [Willisornis vidua]|uniref:Uncharacterized protein n=1 Tax=Willisornis vidua TaxID=1566151 RepID=A0ABQ9D9S7_9PASS|nr:hypothetical protein WISP_82963 [Willisornis vidua]